MPTASHLPFQSQFSPSQKTISPLLPSTTVFKLAPTPSSPTDIWRKPGPPKIQTFNAPLIYKSVPLSAFERARVNVTAKWERLYDQGGLVFILPQAGKSEDEISDMKWIKTGIEFYEGEVFVSTVACDRWADWSLVKAGIRDGNGEKKSVVLEMERNATEGTLWIYVVLENGKRIPLREVTWALSEGEQDIWVGVYAATPTIEGRGENDGLVVEFTGWELEINK